MQVRQSRQALELTEGECWALLGSVPVGRVVFMMRAMPTIRLVNHVTDRRTVVFRSHLGAAIVGHAGQEGAVVCYEADELDEPRRTGWSVIVTGLAEVVREPAAVACYQRLLEPWAEGQMDYVIAIRPQAITGIRLVGWCR